MLNNRPIVLLDSDDVLGRCIKKMTDEVFKLVGRQYTEEEILTWDLFDTVKHVEYPALKDVVYETMKSPGWCLGIEPFPGAVEGVKRLREIAEVFVCTSPMGGPFWEYERREWLWQNFEIGGKRVLQGHSKFLVHSEVFVDDRATNVVEWIKYNHEHSKRPGLGMLWDRPHNKGAPLERVHSWEELYEKVTSLK